MNILLINHYAGSVHHGMEFRPYYLAREWTKQGHKVTILAASFSHLRKSNPSISASFEVEEIDGINYLWIKAPEYSGNGVNRVINMAVFCLRGFKKYRTILKLVSPDLVISSSTYPADIYLSKFLATKSKAKLAFEIHDLWPLSPMELGNMPWYHPFIFFMQIAEDFAYRVSDKVISILPNTLEHCKKHGLTENQFLHIPNGFFEEETQDIQPLNQEYTDLINRQKNLGKFLVGYAGGHSISNAMEFLVEGAKFLDNSKFHIFLVGSGSEKEHLVKKAQESNCCITFLEPVLKKQVPSFLIKMDALYLGWRDSKLYRFGISPNKLVDYLLSGRPVIHSTNAPNDLVKEALAGISVPAESIEELAEAIKKISLLTDNERSQMGRRGRDFALANLNYSILSKKFLSEIKK